MPGARISGLLLLPTPHSTAETFLPAGWLAKQKFYNCTADDEIAGVKGCTRGHQEEKSRGEGQAGRPLKSLGRRLRNFCDLFARNKRDADNLRKTSHSAAADRCKPKKRTKKKGNSRIPNRRNFHSRSQSHSHSHSILFNNFIWEYIYEYISRGCPTNKPTEMKMFRVCLKLVCQTCLFLLCFCFSFFFWKVTSCGL